jgi:RNA polymerase sigma-70 factor (ECF subfamily)
MNDSFAENRELLAKCFSGDRKSAENFVRRFSSLVYQSIQYTLMTKQVFFSKQDLEDLHHSVFLKLFEHKFAKLRQYKGKNGCSLGSWIRIITVRTVLDHLRNKGYDAIGWQNRRIPLDQLPELRLDESAIEGRLETTELNRMLQACIERLSPRDRLLIKLHIYQGLPLPEVAETMKISISNVHTLKHRAVQRLKSQVESELIKNN